MANFNVKVRRDEEDKGTNHIEVVIGDRELTAFTSREDDFDPENDDGYGDEAQNQAFYYAVEHIADLERRLGESLALLDQVWKYVDANDLARLGQDRVKALIDNHEWVSSERDGLLKYIEDLRKAHNQSDVLVHNLLQKGPPNGIR